MRAVLIAGVALAAISFALLLLAGPAYRIELTELRTAFTVLRWAAYGGIAGALVSLAALAALRPAPGRLLVLGILGAALGAVTAFVPWRWRERARSTPPIHDISTDLERPPAFDAILPLRANARNPAEYGGPEIAAQQRAGYPDLGPLVLPLPPDAAFARARAAAAAMDWEIVAADSFAGRIEATATTAWFGFKDDVVVRITPVQGGSRVDVRSVSRVGRSDVGTNAARIRAYLARLAG
jgi:uncharacterized protein (DUF1499 family)